MNFRFGRRQRNVRDLNLPMNASTQGVVAKIMMWSLLCVFPLVAGICILYGSFAALQLGWESESWPKISGTITKSEMERREVTETRRNSRTNNRSSSKKIVYEAHLEFEYAIGSVKYKGNDLNAAFAKNLGRNSSEDIVNKYPVGAKVEVFYNPTQPQVSLLEAGASTVDYAMMLMGFFFSSIGFFMAYRMGFSQNNAQPVQEVGVDSVVGHSVSSGFADHLAKHDPASFDPTKKKTGT